MPGRRGGNISTRGAVAGGRSPVADVRIQIDGVEKSSAEFKRIRHEANGLMRDAQQKVGERVVLPELRDQMRPVVGKWADTLYVQRDRIDVFIGSRLKGDENRALGWLNFGGQRARDHHRRVGPHILEEVLDDKQPAIRDAIMDAILDRFEHAGFETS